MKMLDGYLEFFMDSATAELYQSLRRELEELINTKVSENLAKSECLLLLSFCWFISFINTDCCFCLVFM